MSNYKYTNSSLVATAKKGNDPKNQYIELFQQTLSDQFYNSSDWWTIQEETSAGSEVYTNIDIRLNHVINAETGLKLGDDWKTLLFKEIDHNVELGKHYIFDDNTWLTINTEFIKNLTGTCTIRRCNNTLRWIDEGTGAYYEEPCCIEYMVKEARDYATQGSPFMTPGGFLHIEMQFNSRSNLINENQRFLFGNPEHWVCYKVVGTGINDFRNIQTYDTESAKILSLDLIANFVNDELDDIVNGIADVHTNLYTLDLNRITAQGAPTDTVQLLASVTYNGDSVTRNLEWATSNYKIATVGTTGLVTLKTTGSCIITANIENNTTSASCSIIVSASPSPNIDIIIDPDINYILEGSQRLYSVNLYQNDVIQSGSFVLTCSGSNVPSANYTFAQIDGNHFFISNKIKDVTSHLTVQCASVSGSYTKSMDIFLKGGW